MHMMRSPPPHRPPFTFVPGSGCLLQHRSCEPLMGLHGALWDSIARSTTTFCTPHAAGHLTIWGLEGWRFVFVTVAAVSIAIGVLTALFARDPRMTSMAQVPCRPAPPAAPHLPRGYE